MVELLIIIAVINVVLALFNLYMVLKMKDRKEWVMLETNTIAENLKRLRLEKGKTRNEVAEENGITLRSVEAYERGDRVPRDSVKVKLANYFNESIESIFFGK